MGPIILELLLVNIIMKVFICLSALFAIGQCGPLNAFLTSGAASGPVHAAYGAAVATKRGFRNIALEGFSEDDNQDGFVDPIGQVVAPVTYAAPYYGYHHALPVVKVEAPKVEVKAAPVVTYAHAAPVLTHPVTYTHTLTHPVTYTHTVPAGVLTHTVHGAPVVGGFLPGLVAAPAAAAAPAADEGVTEA